MKILAGPYPTISYMLVNSFVRWYAVLSVGVMAIAVLNNLAILSQIRSGVIDANFLATLLDVASDQPATLRDFSPFIVFFGTLFAILQLHGRGELIALRAVGFSVWNMISVPASICILISLIFIIALPWINRLETHFDNTKTVAEFTKSIYGQVFDQIKKKGLPEELLLGSSLVTDATADTMSGHWINLPITVIDDDDSTVLNRRENSHMVLRIENLETINKKTLFGVEVTKTSTSGKILERVSIDQLVVDGGMWKGYGIHARKREKDRDSVWQEKRLDEQTWSRMPDDMLAILRIARDGLVVPFWQLLSLSERMALYGINPSSAVASFYQMLLRPFWLIFMVLMAVACTFYLYPRSELNKRGQIAMMCALVVVVNMIHNITNASVMAGVFPIHILWPLPLIGICGCAVFLFKLDHHKRLN